LGLHRETQPFEASDCLSLCRGAGFCFGPEDQVSPSPHPGPCMGACMAWPDCPWLSGVISGRFAPLLTSLKPFKKRGVVGRPLGAEDQSQNAIFNNVIVHVDDACGWSVTQVSFLAVGPEIAWTELTLPYCSLGFGWQRGVFSHGACMHSLLDPATPCHPGMHLWLCSVAVPVTARNRCC
jgi:hypothetical protein